MSTEKAIVLVTGGNAGIGLEIITQLLTDGSFHVLLGARSVERGEAAVKDLQSRNLPGTIELVQIDLVDEDSITAAAMYVEEKHGRLDDLVNNGGIMRGTGSPAEEMVLFFRTNAISAYLTVEAFKPLLKKSQLPNGRAIVNITSGAGSIGNRMTPGGQGEHIQNYPYRASKAAMNMISACQYRELSGEGFKVFLYGPGPTKSRHNTWDQSKPTSVGAAPVIEMLKGLRDGDNGVYLEYGREGLGPFPW
ncbi:putative short-chain dehydrogenase [Xylariaceae sp. FL0255]|nr:putative short-chain dehydrogenase [Xylariaceae sp. FL0255]